LKIRARSPVQPGKTDTLTQAGATAVVTSLAELVLPLRARPLPN
jgi:hypothetical protein